MLKATITNTASLTLLLALSTAYFSYAADLVPAESATMINLVLVPMILGAVSLFLVRGPYYVAVLVLAVLPIAHALYLGGDPAKQGLERFVAIIEFLFLLLGLTIAYLVRRYFSSR